MITAKKLAELLKAEIRGNEETIISEIKPLDLATPQSLTFYSPSSKKTLKTLHELACQTTAGVILVKDFLENCASTQIKVPNPMGAVIQIATMLYKKPRPETGIHSTAIVDPSASIAENVAIGAYCVVGKNVTIGANSVIHPHVVIYDGAKIGADCILHSFSCIREFVVLGNDCVLQNGAIVGGDGFGYIPDPQLGHRRIPHIGTVVFEDSVDLGANTTVDRATLGETKIKRAAKIDNLVMIGHNDEIGERTILCAQTGVSGSSTVGNDCILAGQVGVADHVHIGNKVRASAKSGIPSDIPDNTDVAGYPMEVASDWRRQVVLMKRLGELFDRLRAVEKKLS